jgi:hypothetical protein
MIRVALGAAETARRCRNHPQIRRATAAAAPAIQPRGSPSGALRAPATEGRGAPSSTMRRSGRPASAGWCWDARTGLRARALRRISAPPPSETRPDASAGPRPFTPGACATVPFASCVAGTPFTGAAWGAAARESPASAGVAAPRAARPARADPASAGTGCAGARAEEAVSTACVPAGGGAAAGAGAAGAGGSFVAGGPTGTASARGRKRSGSRYPCGSLLRRMPRYTYGTSSVETPLGPTVPTGSPSATSTPRRTSKEPRCTSVTE